MLSTWTRKKQYMIPMFTNSRGRDV